MADDFAMTVTPQYVVHDKGSNTFRISIPGHGGMFDVPADYLPELVEQLIDSGTWLSCYEEMEKWVWIDPSSSQRH